MHSYIFTSSPNINDNTISLSSSFLNRQQFQQYIHPYRWDPRLHLCNRGSASGDGDVERVPSRPASSLGGVSEQVLRRRWLQVCSLHFHSSRKRRRVSDDGSFLLSRELLQMPSSACAYIRYEKELVSSRLLSIILFLLLKEKLWMFSTSHVLLLYLSVKKLN